MIILSAGIAAMSGGRASSEAVDVVREMGLELSDHESQPLSDRLVRFADLILAMTRGPSGRHSGAVAHAAPRTAPLSRDGTDVADPIGGPPEMYRRCVREIDRQLELWMQELDLTKVLAEPGSESVGG